MLGCELRAEGKRGQKHDTQDILEPQAETKAGLESRRGQKRESTNLIPDLEEEVDNTTWTVLDVCGSAPIQGGSSSSTDVLVVSLAAVSIIVEGTNQSMSVFRRMLESNLRILVQLDRCASMRARPETSRN